MISPLCTCPCPLVNTNILCRCRKPYIPFFLLIQTNTDDMYILLKNILLSDLWVQHVLIFVYIVCVCVCLSGLHLLSCSPQLVSWFKVLKAEIVKKQSTDGRPHTHSIIFWVACTGTISLWFHYCDSAGDAFCSAPVWGEIKHMRLQSFARVE